MNGKLIGKLKCFMVLFSLVLISYVSTVSYAGSTETLLNKAKKYLGEGEYSLAINELYKVSLTDPSYPYTYGHLAKICDVVLRDYGLALLFYEKELSLLKFSRSFIGRRQPHSPATDSGNIGNTSRNFNDEIKEIELKRNKLIKTIFENINKPVYQTYIKIKKGKPVYDKPDTDIKGILSNQRKFVFLALHNNWFKVKLSSAEEGWINCKDVDLIYQPNVAPTIPLEQEKLESYEEFKNHYVNSYIFNELNDDITLHEKLIAAYPDSDISAYATKRIEELKSIEADVAASVPVPQEEQESIPDNGQNSEELKEPESITNKEFMDDNDSTSSEGEGS